ncbi:acyl carrier protein [Beduinella massiliensis]|uniref:acyl carrier protein n=1 Tax=Beduinella massiliensis TaxID=1852363 RepID=UPI000C81A556
MNNKQKYDQVFKTAFNVSDEQLPALVYQGIEAWDSVGHMGLIAELEEAFDMMFDTDDIIDFSSYEKGKELLKKYNVET